MLGLALLTEMISKLIVFTDLFLLACPLNLHFEGSRVRESCNGLNDVVDRFLEYFKVPLRP